MRNIYAWVTLMPDDRWSFVGATVPHLMNTIVPLVSHDRATMERFREVAIAHGKATGQPVEFVMYRAMETLERIEPTV